MTMRRVRPTLKQKATHFVSFGHRNSQITVYANDDGTYTFLKKYLSNGASILLAENQSKTDSYLLYKELNKEPID